MNTLDEEAQNVDLIDLKTAIRDLEERERQIIVLRYFKDMTQQQIAGIWGFPGQAHASRRKCWSGCGRR